MTAAIDARRVRRKKRVGAAERECPHCEYERRVVFVVENFVPLLLIMLDGINLQKPDEAQKTLIEMLRMPKTKIGALEMIADMIDPAGDSFWKLTLTRRRPGIPKHSRNIVDSWLYFYEERRKKLTESGHPTPAKTALGEMAARHKMKDGELRAILERAQGKRRRKR